MAYTAKLLIRDVPTAKKTDSVLDAAKRMKQAKMGCIVVTENKKPIGMFTERDLINRVVADGVDPAKTPISKVMTSNPIVIDACEPLDIVFSTLALGHFRNLPITDRGDLVGLVSLSDLALVLREVYREDKYIQYFVDFFNKENPAPKP